MLKITAIGNLTNDVELKCHEDGKPYAILRIASDRRYRDREGNKLLSVLIEPTFLHNGGNLVRHFHKRVLGVERVIVLALLKNSIDLPP